ncbi:MAG: VWA domain-containing protein [Candidatus Aminicenantes bacterium]|nr:VWA domain-containing protein [Candidatus Aminicenantes bacterium]
MNFKIGDLFFSGLKGLVVFFLILTLNSGYLLCDWLPETRLSKDIRTSTTSPANQCDIVVDNLGDIHVVWLDDRNKLGVYEVYYRKYSKSGGWGSETRLTFKVTTYDSEGNPVDKNESKADPGIAADSAGNLYVSFENKSTKTPNVLSCDGTTGKWEIFPTKLGTGGLTGINVVLTVDKGNNVHALWRGLVSSKPQIFYAKYVSGSWTAAQQITGTSSQKQTPTLTVDKQGNIHAAWADSRDSTSPLKYEIYYKKKPASGSWGKDKRLSFALSSDSLKPYITVSSSGDLHLTYEDDRDGNFEIYYLFKPASAAAWGSEKRLTKQSGSSQNAHLCVDALGQVHLLWQDGRYLGGLGWDQFSLYYNKKTTSWGVENRLVSKGCRGSITADSASHLHVAFTTNLLKVGNPEVYYLEFDPGKITTPVPDGVVIVLDISGSMGWKEDGSQAKLFYDSRLYKAGQAISAFLDRFNLRNPNKAYFGLVTFPHSNQVCPSAEKVIPLSSLTDASRYKAIKTTIPGIKAGGWTPMTAGLTAGKGLLASGTTLTKKMLLLVSDGYHNCPSQNFPPGFLNSFTDPIYTVGIGTKIQVDLPRLNSIATLSGGGFRDATTATHLNLMSWFKTIIQSRLGLQAECDPGGKIARGQKISHPVRITDFDTDIVFDLSWYIPKEGCVDFILRTPRGTIINPALARNTAGIVHISRDTYRLYFLQEKYLKGIQRAGEWAIELFGEDIEPGSTEPYNYGVLMDSSLKMQPLFDRPAYRTGDPVTLKVTVTEQRKRLPAHIEVLVRAPQEWRGNWFAHHPVEPALFPGSQKFRDGDSLSDLNLKAEYLAGEYQQPFPEERREMVLFLYDDGSHGDFQAKDGVYTNTFPDTEVPGTYTFDILVRGQTSTHREFRRQQVVQKYIEVNVNREFTEVRLEPLRSGTDEFPEFQLIIIPRDRYGNHLGPGYGERISISSKEGLLVGKLRDHLDGRYTRKFRLSTARREEPRRVTITARVLKVDMIFDFEL